MSTPISEMITRATVSLTPGIVVSRSAASRKGRKTSSAWCSTCCTAAVSVSICAGAASARTDDATLHAGAAPRAVADALPTVRASQASVTTKRAFEFLVLTAARSGEVRLATWDEMDLDAGVWTIPATRMKAKRDHRVPLSGRALAILHDVQRLSDGTSLVFRSLRGKPVSNMTLSKLIKEIGIAAVPHGFRSSFPDWAAERTSTPREVVEAALAHTVRNPTEAAYARSDLFERRRRLMDDWAAYLSGAHGQVRQDDGNRASRPGVLPTLQPTSR